MTRGPRCFLKQCAFGLFSEWQGMVENSVEAVKRQFIVNYKLNLLHSEAVVEPCIYECRRNARI